MKSFIKIDNNFFNLNEAEISPFYQIGTGGFAIYTYLLMRQGNKPFIQTTIKDIVIFFNRNINKKKKSKDGLKDKRTILKYLLLLKENKLIICDSNNLNNNTKINDSLLLKIPLTDCQNGFITISEELFYDKIHIIRDIGFSIYCLLYKNHNINYGGYTSEGFANPTEEYIAKVLNIGTTSVKKYIKILEEERLIKIERQEPYKYIDINGKEQVKYLPNHYIVYAKCKVDNKYYIDFKKEN